MVILGVKVGKVIKRLGLLFPEIEREGRNFGGSIKILKGGFDIGGIFLGEGKFGVDRAGFGKIDRFLGAIRKRGKDVTSGFLIHLFGVGNEGVLVTKISKMEIKDFLEEEEGGDNKEEFLEKG